MGTSHLLWAFIFIIKNFKPTKYKDTQTILFQSNHWFFPFFCPALSHHLFFKQAPRNRLPPSLLQVPQTSVSVSHHSTLLLTGPAPWSLLDPNQVPTLLSTSVLLVAAGENHTRSGEFLSYDSHPWSGLASPTPAGHSQRKQGSSDRHNSFQHLHKTTYHNHFPKYGNPLKRSP